MKRYSLFIVMTALLVISIAAGSAYLSSGSREAKYHHPMRGFTAYTSLPAEVAMALSEAYEKEYNIRVNFVQLSSEQILKRLQEQALGAQVVHEAGDALPTGGVDVLGQLVEDGGQ